MKLWKVNYKYEVPGDIVGDTAINRYTVIADSEA